MHDNFQRAEYGQGEKSDFTVEKPHEPSLSGVVKVNNSDKSQPLDW